MSRKARGRHLVLDSGELNGRERQRLDRVVPPASLVDRPERIVRRRLEAAVPLGTLIFCLAQEGSRVVVALLFLFGEEVVLGEVLEILFEDFAHQLFAHFQGPRLAKTVQARR